LGGLCGDGASRRIAGLASNRGLDETVCKIYFFILQYIIVFAAGWWDERSQPGRPLIEHLFVHTLLPSHPTSQSAVSLMQEKSAEQRDGGPQKVADDEAVSTSLMKICGNKQISKCTKTFLILLFLLAGL